MTASIVYLNNVRLETGFAKDHHELTYTKTALYTLAIQEGKIQAIIPERPPDPRFSIFFILSSPGLPLQTLLLRTACWFRSP